MNYKIGETIKKLRHRDGKTQEELAGALGVTCQAVSGWERGTGYPDIEFLPSIANFFHVTIDLLFGYDDDREKKISALIESSESAIACGNGLEKAILSLREGVREFPTEQRLLMNLALALRLQGELVTGTKMHKKSDTMLTADTAANSENPYFIEFCQVCERLLEMNITGDDRMVILYLLVPMYNSLGMTDRAVELGQSQLPINCAREILLSCITTDDGEAPYRGNAIIELLFSLSNVILHGATSDMELLKSGETLEIIRRFGGFVESVFSDGRCGRLHLNLKTSYMNGAVIAASLRRMDEAEEFLRMAVHHHEAYNSAREEEVYLYTAPLVSGTTFPGKNFGNTPGMWKKHIPSLSEEFRELLKKDARYLDLFEN